MIISEIKSSSSFRRFLPKNYSENDASRFATIQEYHTSRAFLVQVNEVNICQYYIFKGIYLLEEFCLPVQKRGKVSIWKQWLKLQLFPKKHVQEALWVTDLWSKNYFHWILECLPRIIAAKKAGINSPLLLPYFVYIAPYVQESLKELSIKTITYDLKQTVSVRTLYLPSHDSPCSFDPRYLEELSNTFLDLDHFEYKSAHRKIFISRKGAYKRKILNEQDLLPILQREGFEIVLMEKLTFKEQRKIMRETKVLMSVHGAGLANMVFLPEGSKIIELHPNVERYNSCFYHLASALKLDYYYSFENGDHKNPQNSNIWVDLNRLQYLLNSL